MAEKKPPKNVWCVEDNDHIWCVAKDRKHKPDAAYTVPTLCGMFVMLPFGVERRRPTCRICCKRLLGKEA